MVSCLRVRSAFSTLQSNLKSHRLGFSSRTLTSRSGHLLSTEDLEELEKRKDFQHPFIRNHVVEYWPEHTRAPTQGQREFSNKYFENRKNMAKAVFKASEIYQAKHTGIPEFAFMGRANAGKSSLINGILGRKVANVSNTPGQTKALHAWGVGAPDGVGGEWRFTILDMPGYGKMIRKEWGDTIKKYLVQRKELRRVFVCVNGAEGVTAYDREAINLLRKSSIPHQIVLTKADKFFTKYGSSSIKTSRLKSMMSDENQQRAAGKIGQRFLEIREVSEPKRGELPAVEGIIATAPTAPSFRTEPGNKKGTLGISALRWLILDALAIRSAATVRDEADVNFSA